MLNTHSTFVEQRHRILKMADDETLLSLCVARVGVVQKGKQKNLNPEMATKKIKSLSGHLLYTYNCSSAGRTPAKIEVLINRNFLRMDFKSLKELP